MGGTSYSAGSARLSRCLIAAAAALLLSAAPAPAATVPSAAATPTVTEVLQYASAPDAPGAQRAGRRLVTGLRGLGLKPRGFEVLPMVLVRGRPARLRR